MQYADLKNLLLSAGPVARLRPMKVSYRARNGRWLYKSGIMAVGHIAFRRAGFWSSVVHHIPVIPKISAGSKGR